MGQKPRSGGYDLIKTWVMRLKHFPEPQIDAYYTSIWLYSLYIYPNFVLKIQHQFATVTTHEITISFVI